MTKDRGTRGYGLSWAGMLLLAIAVLLVSFTVLTVEPNTKKLASQMLEAVSDQSGLCVHLGFHDVRLTTLLPTVACFLSMA